MDSLTPIDKPWSSAIWRSLNPKIGRSRDLVVFRKSWGKHLPTHPNPAFNDGNPYFLGGILLNTLTQLVVEPTHLEKYAQVKIGSFFPK